MSDKSHSSVICVGLTCLDIVSECQYFPNEDDKIGSTTIHNRLEKLLQVLDWLSICKGLTVP